MDNKREDNNIIPVMHKKHFKFFSAVYDKFVETVWQNVTGFLIRTCTNFVSINYCKVITSVRKESIYENYQRKLTQQASKQRDKNQTNLPYPIDGCGIVPLNLLLTRESRPFGLLHDERPIRKNC